MEWCKCCLWQFQICIVISMTTQISLPVTVKTAKHEIIFPPTFLTDYVWKPLYDTRSDMEWRIFRCPCFVCFASLCASVVKKCGLVLVRVGSGCSDAMLPVALLGRNAHTHTHTLAQTHKNTVPCTSEGLVVCGKYPELQPTAVCQEESLCSWGGPSQQTKQGKWSFSCVTWKEMTI